MKPQKAQKGKNGVASRNMENFEKLGVLYLGREHDLKNRKSKDRLVLYDSKDLVTHAVCVGMTITS